MVGPLERSSSPSGCLWLQQFHLAAVSAGFADGVWVFTGAGRRLSRVIDQEVLLDEFPLEDILDDNDSYAEAGVRSARAMPVSPWKFCQSYLQLFLMSLLMQAC